MATGRGSPLPASNPLRMMVLTHDRLVMARELLQVLGAAAALVLLMLEVKERAGRARRNREGRRHRGAHR
jgi:hypothetical protein